MASSRLTIDGTAAKVYGPYAAASGVNFSGVFGTLPAGSHNYSITATDKAGNVSTYSGSFTLTASSGNAKNALLSAASLSALSNSAKVDWLYDLGGLLDLGPQPSSQNRDTSTSAVDAVLAAY